MKKRLCGECARERPESEFEWTNDRYGIPWRKVCSTCAIRVQEQIALFRFDPSEAGEALEPEDY